MIWMTLALKVFTTIVDNVSNVFKTFQPSNFTTFQRFKTISSKIISA